MSSSLFHELFLRMGPGSLVFGLAFCFVIGNILWQLLPKSRSEPPLVFHLIPFVGNAVSYGMDPFKFYTECRQKVRLPRVGTNSFARQNLAGPAPVLSALFPAPLLTLGVFAYP